MSEPAHTDKLSVTIPSHLAEELRSRAGRGNVSSYVTEALVRQLEHDRLGDLLAELTEVHGPVTDEELARARAEWPGR
ncbi:CopG family transcriptional regulator [Kribbella shirazensis]|uniref:Arc/MetJ-type ribon-helix-helix transcriptional regulator n=1 Tax=Kribbella shirazensis TaxID=1105143 RepID=A0A7X5V9C6_9ACTN|nr:CopG family transcriptional regulator [Kribbella shirazensis]NIK56967.1 Arc/MetJ-type ribon-helix-helix transcriptional regulator [Kribbella shirazensis]